MNYSPLLHFRHGKGGVTISTLDLTGRVGTGTGGDGAGLQPRPLDRPGSRRRRGRRCWSKTRRRSGTPLRRTLKNGGCVIYSGLDAVQLAKRGVATETITLCRVAREPGTFSEKIPRNLPPLARCAHASGHHQGRQRRNLRRRPVPRPQKTAAGRNASSRRPPQRSPRATPTIRPNGRTSFSA